MECRLQCITETHAGLILAIVLQATIARMIEEDRLRKLCARAVNATAGNRESAINALRLAVTRYLELNSDEVVITKLLRMPDVAAAMKNKKRAALKTEVSSCPSRKLH